MDLNPCGHSLPRLISLLEALLASTQSSKVSIEAHSNEAKELLQGWPLPDKDVSVSLSTCQCAETQKHQLAAFLEKVEKAVKYSQSVREGRTDVRSPWPDEVGNSNHTGETRKLNSAKDGSPKIYQGHVRERCPKGRLANGFSKRTSNTLAGNGSKSNVEKEHNPLCPLYSGSGADHMQKVKTIRTVGLAEAIDVKGIPPELVTVLKSFHQYINRLRTSTPKNRAETSFIRHLNTVNGKRWDKFSFDSLFKGLPSIERKECYGRLHIFKKDQDASLEHSPQFENNLPCIGIWNSSVYGVLSVDALCVQYQNEDIWNLLQMRIQQLQLSKAERQICDILSCDPLLCNPDLDYHAAPLFLKAATALSSLSSLHLPVLVKTYRS